MANKAEILTGLRRTHSRDLDVLVNSAVVLSDSNIVTGTLNDKTAPVEISSSAVFTSTNSGSLTEADHSGRTLMLSAMGGTASIIIPVASQAGVTYNIVSANVTDNGKNLTFRAPAANGLTFTGGVLDLDEDEAGAGQVAVVYPGGDDDKLILTGPHNFNLTFTATSTTNYLVSGWAVADTVSAFGDLP
jgi:hypothetical protein